MLNDTIVYLYGMIHARYIISIDGLDSMVGLETTVHPIILTFIINTASVAVYFVSISSVNQ